MLAERSPTTAALSPRAGWTRRAWTPASGRPRTRHAVPRSRN